MASRQEESSHSFTNILGGDAIEPSPIQAGGKLEKAVVAEEEAAAQQEAVEEEQVKIANMKEGPKKMLKLKAQKAVKMVAQKKADEAQTLRKDAAKAEALEVEDENEPTEWAPRGVVMVDAKNEEVKKEDDHFSWKQLSPRYVGKKKSFPSCQMTFKGVIRHDLRDSREFEQEEKQNQRRHPPQMEPRDWGVGHRKSHLENRSIFSDVTKFCFSTLACFRRQCCCCIKDEKVKEWQRIFCCASCQVRISTRY